MITLKGIYNSADVMIDDIDDTTASQIHTFLNHEAFKDSKIVIMPDCHAGKGAVVGFTMTSNDKIIPQPISILDISGVIWYNIPIRKSGIRRNIMLTKKEIKERHFKKVYENALIVECACGCGEKMKNKDEYGRDRLFINGHNGRKYSDPIQFKKEWRSRNKKARHVYAYKRSMERKVKLIKIKEEKCNICSLEYNGKNAGIFQFHHLNPKEKLFRLSLSSMWKNWNKILLELNKCQLLCANCHFQIHSQEY